MRDIEKQGIKRLIIWTFAGLGISIAINYGLFFLLGDAAFPWNFVIMIGFFLGFGIWYQRRQFKKMGMLGGNDMPANFALQCLSCGTTFKGRNCPKCGSLGGKTVFGQ